MVPKWGNTWAEKYFLYRDFEAQVYNNKVHGPFGNILENVAGYGTIHTSSGFGAS